MVTLFSGGKESLWALYQALKVNCDVRRLVIVHPPKGSHAYHAPVTSVARLAAQSIEIPVINVGLPTVDIEPPDIKADITPDSETWDDTEIEPLGSALRTLDAELNGGLNGVIAGTVEDEYQADRLRSICDDIGLTPSRHYGRRTRANFWRR